MPGFRNTQDLRDARRRPLLAVATMFAVCAAGLMYVESATSASPVLPSPSAEYTEFRHTTGQHARLPCLLCHRRSEGVTKPIWPGHTPCAGCHAQQFSNTSGPICTICHSDAATGAMKVFPRLRSFNAKFDHSRHTQGSAKPRAGCMACHRIDRRSKGFSVPTRVGAHSVCFTCHAPNAQSGGRDISTCGTCHQLGSPPRGVGGIGAYAASFAHGAHGRARVACAECHAVRAGAGRGQQVTRPSVLQHRSIGRAASCGRCHNRSRAFGGDDFTVCSRCHRGNAWRF